MATASNLNTLLQSEPVTAPFAPYCELSEEADALTVYFKADADYSKRLTDHVTLFLSLETNEMVGCRIKGIKEILEDLPNYIRVNHGGAELSVIFWSFRGGVQDDRVRRALNELAKATEGMTVTPNKA